MVDRQHAFRWFIGDTMTGAHLMDLPVSDASRWSDNLGDEGAVTAVVPRTPAVRRYKLHQVVQPWTTYVGVAWDDTVLQAGPVISCDYDVDADTLTFNAKGMMAWLNRRLILPTVARRRPLYDPTLRRPNPAMDTYREASYHLIVNELVRQALEWPGSPTSLLVTPSLPNQPLHQRTYLGTDLKNLGEALVDITEVVDGVDIAIRPHWVDQQSRLSWEVTTGDPYIAGPEPIVWDLSRPGVNLSNLRVGSDGADMTTRVVFTGGRDTDEVIVATSENEELLDAGFPLLERADTTHTSVSDQTTLQGWADDDLSRNSRPVTSCSFSVQADGYPTAEAWKVGDWALIVADDIPYLEQGNNYMRIMGRSGGAAGDIQVDVTPVRGEDAGLFAN